MTLAPSAFLRQRLRPMLDVHARAGLLLVAGGLLLGAPSGCRRTTDEGNISPLANRGQADPPLERSSSQIQPDTYLAAGRLAESRGDLATAALQYRQLLRNKPDDREGLYRLGLVLSRQRDPASLEVWKRYLGVTNQSAAGWANLGFAHELLGQPDEAERAYRAGIARDPRDKACRVNYGMFLAARGHFETAAMQLSQALPPSQAWYNIGAVCEQQGRTESAVAAYRKAIEVDSGFEPARQRLSALEAPSTAPSTRPITGAR